jgi:hypothetical protein
MLIMDAQLKRFKAKDASKFGAGMVGKGPSTAHFGNQAQINPHLSANFPFRLRFTR